MNHPNHNNNNNDISNNVVMNDPYTILGISSNASLSEIRNAYKQKALQYHPDKVNQNMNRNNDFERIQAHEQLTKINTAYQLLSDPHQRYLYDVQKERKERSNHESSSLLRRYTTTTNKTSTKSKMNDDNDMNPFDFFDRFFQQEFGADIFGPSFPKNGHSSDSHPSNNTNGELEKKENDLFPSFPFPFTSLFGKRDRFSPTFSSSTFHDVFRQHDDMMKRMMEEMKQQGEGEVFQHSNKNRNENNVQSRYYSTSSSSSSTVTKKDPNTGEWITTTTRTIHNRNHKNHKDDDDPPQTVQETIVYHPDGTIKERTLIGNEALLSPPTTTPPSKSLPFWLQQPHPPALGNNDHSSSSNTTTTTNATGISHREKDTTSSSSSSSSWWSSLWRRP